MLTPYLFWDSYSAGMKIGYPAMNLGLGCTSAHTFRLANLSEERFVETARQNLDCLKHMLHWNVTQDLLFFRIGSSLIPFASHPSMTFPWQEIFRRDFEEIGQWVRQHNMRISLHPGHFVVLNSPTDTIYRNAVAELQYHADMLNLMGLDTSHKFQIHLAGLHGDSAESVRVFIERYHQLPQVIRDRLVIENDERTASLQDCLHIHEQTGIPILFDTLHHEVRNNGETMLAALKLAMATWKYDDGIPMVDYSTQDPDKKPGAHTRTLDVEKFRSFIRALRGREIDIMLEIKNKEASALQARLTLDNL